jgi:hypothetical protein
MGQYDETRAYVRGLLVLRGDAPDGAMFLAPG